MLLTNIFAVASLMVATAYSKVVSHPRAPIYEKSAHFALRVDGTDMFTTSFERYDYVHFSMDEGPDHEIRIRTLDQKPIKEYSITPRKLPIKARTEGNQLIFSMKKAHYLIIKIDDKKEFVVVADPLETDVPDPKGKNVYNVLNFGADGSGKGLSKGFQEAADEAGKTGGIIYVPEGLYYVGNIILRSHTSLYLASGAILRFTGKKDDYEILFSKSDIGPGTWWIRTEFESENIKIYGRGTIDGNGQYTRDNKFMAQLVVPTGTTNFTYDGVLVRDGSFWSVVCNQVEEATFTNLKVLNRFSVKQDDGFDANESYKVRVLRGIAIATDDSFSTKTWPENTGTTVPFPYPPRDQSDIFFDNCLAWTDCWGYKVGQGVYQDQTNIKFQNSVVYNAAVGMGVHHKFGKGTVSKVTFQNMDVERLHGNAHGKAAWMSAYVEDVGKGHGPVKDIWVKNIRVRSRGYIGVWLSGYNDNSKVTDVTLTNILMGAEAKRAKTLSEAAVVETKHSGNLKIV